MVGGTRSQRSRSLVKEMEILDLGEEKDLDLGKIYEEEKGLV